MTAEQARVAEDKVQGATAFTLVDGSEIRVFQARAAFNRVADKQNWKLPVKAAVGLVAGSAPFGLDYLAEFYAKSVEFMTGSKATVWFTDNADRHMPRRKIMHVEAAGYYAAVGA